MELVTKVGGPSVLEGEGGGKRQKKKKNKKKKKKKKKKENKTMTLQGIRVFVVRTKQLTCSLVSETGEG